MTAFLIGAAELAAMAAGQTGVVTAPGMKGLEALPLMVLQPQQGVLRRAGSNPGNGAAVPLPETIQPLAILAPNGETASDLAAGMPIGIPVLLCSEPMRALLAYLLRIQTKSGPSLQRPNAGMAELTEYEPEPEYEPLMEAPKADFQEVRLHQHTVSADGSYSHIDLGLVGLAAAAGVWREARLKLFDRRGTVGIEVRDLKGWPTMFDVWPKSGSDRFGPFWRLEAQTSEKSLDELASPHNKVLVAALLDVLPAAARSAAEMAGLTAGEQEEWEARGRSLASAVTVAAT